ncbi:MAG: tetracycline resistance MFS efflux pump [Bacteroidia bacterium]
MEKKNSKGTLLALFITVFVDLLGVGIVIPVLPLLFADPSSGLFSADVKYESRLLLYGFLSAAFPLAQFFGAPILGALADRYGRKPILALSLCGTLLGYVVFAWAVMNGNLIMLFVSRALDGFTGGNISVAFSSIADISDEKNKTRNFGLIGMAFGLGFIIGPYIGGKLADPNVVSWFNYSTPFWAAALLSALNLLLVFFVYQETIRQKKHTAVSLTTGFKNVAKAFASANLRTMFVVMFLTTFGFQFFTQFFQIFLSDKFGYTASDVGDIFAYIGIWIAITQGGLTRPMSKYLTPKQTLNFTIFCLGFTFMILVLPEQRSVLYFILPLIAIFQGLLSPNALNLVSSQASPEEQGEIMGINQSVSALAQAVPPIIAGYIVSIDRNLPIMVASGCTLLAAVIFVALFRERKSSTAV